jgi:hypothetical protein
MVMSLMGQMHEIAYFKYLGVCQFHLNNGVPKKQRKKKKTPLGGRKRGSLGLGDHLEGRERVLNLQRKRFFSGYFQSLM